MFDITNQKKLDKALKRNLEAQKAKIEKTVEAQSTNITTDDIEDSAIVAEPDE